MKEKYKPMKKKRFVIINDQMSTENNTLYYNIEQKACFSDFRMATVFPDERSAHMQTTYKDMGCFNYSVVPYEQEEKKWPDIMKPFRSFL